MSQRITKISSSTRLRALSSAATALALLATSNNVWAQDADAEETEFEEVVVTGTRIKSANLVSTSPVTTVSSEDFQLKGFSTVENLLRDLPQTAPGQTPVTNNGGNGTASVNLRNQGSRRTLVLMNGRRLAAFSPTGVVDINSVPSALIKRVDVVTGGASAVYGSDAMAGVVNFILKDDFEGIELDTGYSFSGHGDGEATDVSLTVGTNFADDRGNIVLNVDYTHRNAITQDLREFSLFSLNSSDLSKGGSITNLEGRISGTYNVDGVVGAFAEFLPNGDITGPGATQFNFNPFNYLQTPMERWVVTSLASYDITDDIRFNGRASYVSSDVTSVLAPSGTFGNGFNLNIGNSPFFSDQARAILADATNNVTGVGAPDGLIDAIYDTNGDGIVDEDAVRRIGVGRRTIEVGTRDRVRAINSFQVVAGLEGEMAESWDWEVFGQYANTDRTTLNRGAISLSRSLQAAVAIRDANGNIVCQDQSNGCVPANFFGKGNLSEEGARYIALDMISMNQTQQLIVGGSVAGDTSNFDISGPFSERPIGLALGVEYRKETSLTQSDDNLHTGNNIGLGATPNLPQFSYNVKEAYLEMLLPILEDKPFAKDLTLDLGVRYSDYSTAGTVASYKYGGSWSPVDDVRVRGMYQRAVRAPNIQELAAAQNNGNVTSISNDPCADGNPVGNAELTALCIATGVPAGAIGFVGGPISGQVGVITGGNLNLFEESSDTYTLGVVWTPSQVPGLNISVDYYDIEISDFITGFGGSSQSVVDGCYTIQKDANGSFCSIGIIRDPLTGSLNGDPGVGIFRANANTANQSTEGVDLAISYTLDTDFAGGSSFHFDYRSNFLLEQAFQGSIIAPVTECKGLYGNTCGDPDAKYRHNFRTTWVGFEDQLTLSVLWRYLTGVDYDLVGSTDAVTHVDAYSYFDFSGNWQMNDKINIRFGVSNVFDKLPPILGSDQGASAVNSANTFPNIYDAIGRYIFTGVKVTF